jgi:signal transduction histidine kinase
LKSVFLANVSHEIRTPLGCITGFSELLEKTEDHQKQKDYCNVIVKCSNDLLAIVNDILDISKLETGSMEIFYENTNLNLIIDDLYSLYSIQTKRDVEIKVFKELKNENASVSIDSIRIKQILSNLINNSIKFTYRGVIEFGYKIKGKKIEFFVKDTGSGIPKNKQYLVFEPFRQVEKQSERTFGSVGLGLAIVKGLVKLHKGRIWFDSEPNKGTSFYFSIPYKK